MLLFFMFIVMLIVGIVTIVIIERSQHLSIISQPILATIAIIMTILGLEGIVCFGCPMIAIHTDEEITYGKVLQDKEVLEFRLKHTDELSSTNPLYTDITNFNKTLKETKDNYNNIWIGALYSKKNCRTNRLYRSR